MQRITAFLFFITFSASALGQGAATSFDVDGIKVIFKPTVKEIISVDMYFRGGVTNYPPDKAGIETLTLAATAECGTKKYPKNAFKDKEDAYGISVGGSSGYDFGLISLNCISKYFNEGWDLFSEAVVNPVFDERELELLKTKLVSAIRQGDSDPDSRIDQMAISNAFTGTPYAIDPSGTELSLAKLGKTEVTDYYRSLINKNRIFLVVAGKISKEAVIAKIRASFATLPAKAYKAPVYAVPSIRGNKFFSEERQLATNYIEGIFNAPEMSSPDYAPYRLAFSVLNNRLFSEIRTKRNLSYAPSARVKVLKMPFSIVYVSTTNPKAAVEVIANELNRIKRTGFSEEEFEGAKSGFITSNYMKEESTAAISASLGLAEIMGNWKLAEQLPDELNNATLEQMNLAFNKYARGIIWNYLGDKKQAESSVAAFNIPVR